MHPAAVEVGAQAAGIDRNEVAVLAQRTAPFGGFALNAERADFARDRRVATGERQADGRRCTTGWFASQ